MTKAENIFFCCTVLLSVAKASLAAECSSSLDHSFRLPHLSRIIDIKPARISFDESRGKARLSPIIGTLAAQVTDLRGALPVRRVFYPFAGTDAATAFGIFPDARLVVSLSNVPFLSLEACDDLSVCRRPLVASTNPECDDRAGAHAFGFRNTCDIPWEGILMDTVGILKAHFKDLRLRKVQILVGEREGIDRRRFVHGRIQFDTGPGTPRRTLIHIHTRDLVGTVDYSKKWWMKSLRSMAPEAILIKAAHRTLVELTPRRLRDSFLALLRTNHATLVTGGEEFFSSREEGLRIPEPAFVEGLFSYSFGAEIYQF